MENEKITRAPADKPEAPAALTTEQAAQVAGGALSVSGLTGSRGGMCCLTCASYGRPLFSAVAAAMAA